jgi:hypothetical protein
MTMAQKIEKKICSTKFRTKVSVPIGTPIPTKPSGKKGAREISVTTGSMI